MKKKKKYICHESTQAAFNKAMEEYKDVFFNKKGKRKIVEKSATSIAVERAEKNLNNLKSLVFKSDKNNTENGIKYDDGKLRWELLPLREIKDVVDILTLGAKKYKDDNWKFVEPISRYIGAFFRHIYAWTQGEKFDKETGKNHLAHAICCLLFLLYHDNEEKK